MNMVNATVVANFSLRNETVKKIPKTKKGKGVI